MPDPQNHHIKTPVLIAPVLLALTVPSGCGECRSAPYGDYRFRNGDRCISVIDDQDKLSLRPESVTLRPSSSAESGPPDSDTDEGQSNSEDVQEFVVQGYLDDAKSTPADGYEVWIEAVPCALEQRDDTVCPDTDTDTDNNPSDINPSDFLRLSATDGGNCERKTDTILSCQLSVDGLATFGVVPGVKETVGDVCVEVRSGESCRRSRIKISYGFQQEDVVRFIGSDDPSCGATEAAPCPIPLARLDAQACSSTQRSCDSIRRSLSGHIQVLQMSTPSIRNFSIFTDVSLVGDDVAGAIGLITGDSPLRPRSCDDSGAFSAQEVFTAIIGGMSASQAVHLCADGAASGPIRIATRVRGNSSVDQNSYAYVDVKPQPAYLEVLSVSGAECVESLLDGDWCYTAQLRNCDSFPIEISSPSDILIRRNGAQVETKQWNGGVLFGFAKDQDSDPAPAFEALVASVDLACNF